MAVNFGGPWRTQAGSVREVNENSAIRTQGERIAVLEAMNEEMRASIDHLHKCVHDVKDDALRRDRTWDRRWNILIGAAGAIILISGYNMKTLLEVLSKVR